MLIKRSFRKNSNTSWKKEVYVIRIHPEVRKHAPDIFLEAEELVFLDRNEAWKYAFDCENTIDQKFLGNYSIKRLWLMK